MKSKRIASALLCMILCMAMLFNGLPVVSAADTQQKNSSASITNPEADSPKIDSTLDGRDRDNLFRFNGNTNVTVGYSGTNIRLHNEGAGARTYVSFPGTSIDVAEYPVMLMKIKVNDPTITTQGRSYAFFYQSTEMNDISNSLHVAGQYAATTDWQHVWVDFRDCPAITGNLKLLCWSLFFNEDVDATIDLGYITFFKSVDAAQTFRLKDGVEFGGGLTTPESMTGTMTSSSDGNYKIWSAVQGTNWWLYNMTDWIADYPYVIIKYKANSEGNITTWFNLATPSGFHYNNTGLGSDTAWAYAVMDATDALKDLSSVQNIRADISSGFTMYVDAVYGFVDEAAYLACNLEDIFAEFDPNGSIMDTTPGIEIISPAYTPNSTFEENGVRSFDEIRYSYVMDYSKTPAEYWKSNVFGVKGVHYMTISDGNLWPMGDLTLYTKKTLGDQYALTGGELSVSMAQNAGSVTLGARQVMVTDDVSISGLYFTLNENGTVQVTEASSGCDVTINTGKTWIGWYGAFRVSDTEERITLYKGDELLCYVEYNSLNKSFAVFDAAGTLCGSYMSLTLPVCGFASVRFNTGFSGFSGDIAYTHSEIAQKKFVEEYDVDYSTWNAVDDLNRSTATESSLKTDKYVGVFYFMCHDGILTREPMLDTTKLYMTGGVELIQNTYSQQAGSGVYWAEPYFGYYKNSDEWILRKHANMLSAAGVDFIYLDLSNNVFYLDDVKRLFDTWLAMRAEGQTTPQISLMFGDVPYYMLNGLYTMYDEIYCNEAYQSLLFQYEGKPLVFGNSDHIKPNVIGYPKWTSDMQTYNQFIELVNADESVKTFFNERYETILSELTIRKCWAYKNANHNGYWDYLQYLNQTPGTNSSGAVEQITVSLGIDAHRGLGRSLTEVKSFGSDEMASYNSLGQYGFGLNTTAQGLLFQKQFENALQSEAKIMMITGWNEWVAGIQRAGENQVTGQTPSSGWTLIDQFSPEYSRDAEPMKLRDGYGFGDNYYYQMVSYIRQFKGIAAVPSTVNGGAIHMAGGSIDLQWEGINPTFTDGVNDTALRSEYSISADQLYVNNTARNDIAYAKITQDADSVYFYAKTAGQLINVDDEGWMNLFIDIDCDPATGWEGYDIRINRARTATTASVERFVDGQWAFETMGNAEMVLGDCSVTFKVARSVLGIGTEAVSFNFKWADNSVTDGDIMKFMELGDAAPDDRFYFSYTASTLVDERGDDPALDASIKFHSASVTVDDEYTLNFKVDPAVLDSVATYQVILVGENGREVFYETNQQEAVLKNGYYVFSIGQIGPHQMGNTVKAILRAYDANGTLMGYDSREYSIQQYCQNKIGDANTTQEIATTLKDMLNYGASVQTYLNPSISSDRLVNAGMDTSTDTNTPNVSADGFSHKPFENRIGFTSVSVRLNNGVEVVMKVIGSTADMHVSNGEIISMNEDGEYVHRISFLKLSQQYTYTIDGATLTYSIPIYIARSSEKVNEQTLALLTQLMKFGTSIRAYRESLGLYVPMDPSEPDILLPEDDVSLHG